MLIATDRSIPENSKVWFLDNIKDAYLNTLSTLLQFITAFKQLPARRLDKKAVLKFLPDTDKKIYSEAIVCLHTILLPTVHSSKYAFFKDIDKALATGSKSFSSPSYTLWRKVIKILRSQETFSLRLIFTRIRYCRSREVLCKSKKGCLHKILLIYHIHKTNSRKSFFFQKSQMSVVSVSR